MVNKLWVLALCLLPLGCGSGDEKTPVTPQTAACDDYCAAARKVGCPKGGDCMTSCMALFHLGCDDLLIDLLACAAPALTDECVPRDAAGGLTCADSLAGYDDCVPIDVGVPETSCGPSTAMSESPASGCQGELECPGLALEVQCDADGACACLRNGTTVGTCDNIMSSAYFCAPHESCCTPFFAPG